MGRRNGGKPLVSRNPRTRHHQSCRRWQSRRLPGVDRPYVLLSCAVSLDGYLDDASDARLVLSGAEDLDRVDELRANSDAILVGAGTIRADNPRLLLRSQARRDARIARGVRPDPVRVTLTTTGDLDSAARIFTTGGATDTTGTTA